MRLLSFSLKKSRNMMPYNNLKINAEIDFEIERLFI